MASRAPKASAYPSIRKSTTLTKKLQPHKKFPKLWSYMSEKAGSAQIAQPFTASIDEFSDFAPYSQDLTHLPCFDRSFHSINPQSYGEKKEADLSKAISAYYEENLGLYGYPPWITGPTSQDEVLLSDEDKEARKSLGKTVLSNFMSPDRVTWRKLQLGDLSRELWDHTVRAGLDKKEHLDKLSAWFQTLDRHFQAYEMDVPSTS